MQKGVRVEGECSTGLQCKGDTDGGEQSEDLVEARESSSMNSVGDRGHFDEFVFAAWQCGR